MRRGIWRRLRKWRKGGEGFEVCLEGQEKIEGVRVCGSMLKRSL